MEERRRAAATIPPPKSACVSIKIRAYELNQKNGRKIALAAEMTRDNPPNDFHVELAKREFRFSLRENFPPPRVIFDRY